MSYDGSTMNGDAMRLALITTGILALAACVQDVGEGKTKATVEQVSPDAAAAAKKANAAAEASENLRVDVANSSIRALGAKVTATHPIDFKTFDGKLSLDDAGAPTAVAFTVKMADLESDHPKLTEHLLNEDFFDVGTYPTSSFQSTEITAGSETEGATHTVSGILEMRGQSKQVSFPATFEVTEGLVKATSEFVINRQDFGVAYPGRPDDLIQDNVRMNISLQAMRKS